MTKRNRAFCSFSSVVSTAGSDKSITIVVEEASHVNNSLILSTGAYSLHKIKILLLLLLLSPNFSKLHTHHNRGGKLDGFEDDNDDSCPLPLSSPFPGYETILVTHASTMSFRRCN